MIRLMLFIILFATPCYAFGPAIQGTLASSNTGAVERKKAAIFSWMSTQVADGKVMSGQMSWGDTTIEAINTNYGKYPALRGFDWFAQSDPTLTTDILQWAGSNGMIHLMYHMPNPFAANAVYSDLTDGNWANLITPGTTENTYFKVSLDKMASTLRTLQLNNVVVILRPLHEMNGNWFWWGTQNATTEEFVAAWQYIYRYLVQTHNLKNIIWLYGPNASYAGSVTAQYPGDAYVDMTGVDVYANTASLAGDATSLSTVSGGKLFCVSEWGQCTPSGCPSGGGDSSNFVANYLPASAVFWMNWETLYGNNFGLDTANSGAATIFSNTKVLTLDEMPVF